MKTGKITWNGTNSASLGVYVSGPGAYNAAEADVTVFQIPGRSGDLVVSNNRYKNIEVVYPAFIPTGLSTGAQGIRNWLRTSVGYADLSDTYDEDHVRRGRVTGVLEFSPVRPDGANFDITFDCMPQRWLTTGLTPQTISSGSISLVNPTEFAARPIVEVTNPAAALEVEFYDGARTITFTATTGYTGVAVIDCETQDVYDKTLGSNLNYLFSIDSADFPVLEANNTITLTGTYSSASVAPRWWEL